ncbi:archaellin/type IV pilin N-terminal domain-containing protein [Nanoarchaeota archaeon]
MNKKALSPLVATLLLVVFAIALGSVVMSWGKAYVEQATTAPEVTVDDIEETSVFEELDERFKKGEITQPQYEELKKVLHGT